MVEIVLYLLRRGSRPTWFIINND